MNKRPDLIELRCAGSGNWTLVVDGEEFPYMVAMSEDTQALRGPIVGPVDTKHPPRITVTLIAKRIIVDHSMRPPAPYGDEAGGP